MSCAFDIHFIESSILSISQSFITAADVVCINSLQF